MDSGTVASISELRYGFDMPFPTGYNARQGTCTSQTLLAIVSLFVLLQSARNLQTTCRKRSRVDEKQSSAVKMNSV
jgi:hypothetical protein